MTSKIFVFGATGRMGKEIAANISARNARGEAVKQVNALEEHPDVVIDFSSPAGAVKAAEWCSSHKVPLVTGSTGLTDFENATVKKCAAAVATLQSPNMSLGVSALAQAISGFATHFDSGEVAIEEVHHKHKKDQPSGTAKFFHDVAKRDARQFVISEPISIRGGEIFGIHKVYFFLEGEWVVFEHHATSRSIFAKGAVAAALWTLKQKPGLYAMSDFLNAHASAARTGEKK